MQKTERGIKMKKDINKITLRFYNNFQIAFLVLFGIIGTAILLHCFSLGYVSLHNLYTKYFVYAILPFVSICAIIQAFRESITVDLEKEVLTFCIGGFIYKKTIPLSSISRISIDALGKWTVTFTITKKSNNKNDLFDNIKQDWYVTRRLYPFGFRLSKQRTRYKSFVDTVNMIIAERYS